MGNIHNSITELVGNTPIVEFHRLEKALGLKGRIAGKLEYFNPAGSHKDRMALEIIEAAEARGDISPDKTTLVEFTSGNTGVAMAAFAAAKGYKFKIGVQNGVSIERSKLLVLSKQVVEFLNKDTHGRDELDQSFGDEYRTEVQSGIGAINDHLHDLLHDIVERHVLGFHPLRDEADVRLGLQGALKGDVAG